MAVSQRNRRSETLQRLACKTLDARFSQEIQVGLNCSPFEAEAVVQVAHEVYLPFLDGSAPQAAPGTVTLVAVCADEPAGKPVAACEKRTVCLRVHRGQDDDGTLHREGPAAFRRARIPEVCQEALSQGGLLTAEDLAYRVFFVSPRTITRDLAALREDGSSVIPLRSTVHDIGPVLTHRTQIVRLALEGKTTTQICQRLRHSPAAVRNYLSTFTRCVQLAERGMQAGQIAFLLRRGRGLVEQYLALLAECRTDRNLGYHLSELQRLGGAVGEKRGRARRRADG
jgi:DNA-binding CsgD family transcriptional regulator